MRSKILPIVLGTVLASPVLSQTVETVTLSTTGETLLTGTLPVSDGSGRFPVQKSEIDTFMKSLRLYAEQAGYMSVSMPGPGKIKNTLDGMVISPASLENSRTLLEALRGTGARIQNGPNEVAGVILGITDTRCEDQDCLEVTLLSEGSLTRVVLKEQFSVSPDDPDISEQVRQVANVAAESRNENRVLVTITPSEPSVEDIGLSFMDKGVPWATSWRADVSDDDVTLTGWAVIENRTPYDWDQVDLALITGSVQTLNPTLYDQALSRPAQARRSTGLLDQAFTRNESMSADNSMVQSLGAAPVAAPEVAMNSTDSFSRYGMPFPVTIPSGDISMVPFLTEDLRNARVLRYRGGQGAEHPDIAMTIENPLPLRLPAGVVSIYEDGLGHAGDARIPEIQPLDEETVVFGRDLAVDVTEHRSSRTISTEVRAINGLLRVRKHNQQSTRYNIDGAADRSRIIRVEHPIRQNWQVVTGNGERSDGHVAWDVAVGADESVTHTVLEETRTFESYSLVDMNPDQLVFWVENADERTRRLLEDMAELLRAVSQAERTIADAQADIESETANVTRLLSQVEVLGMTGGSGAARVERVDEAEAEIGRLKEEIDAAREVIRSSNEKIAEMIESRT